GAGAGAGIRDGTAAERRVAGDDAGLPALPGARDAGRIHRIAAAALRPLIVPAALAAAPRSRFSRDIDWSARSSASVRPSAAFTGARPKLAAIGISECCQRATARSITRIKALAR